MLVVRKHSPMFGLRHHGTVQLYYGFLWCMQGLYPAWVWYNGIPQVSPSTIYTTLRVQYPYSSESHSTTIRPLLVVNVFLVTSQLTKACRAGGYHCPLFHYLPQHNILYNLNISRTNQRQLLALILVIELHEHAQCQIMTIIAKTGSLLNSMRAGDQKHISK